MAISLPWSKQLGLSQQLGTHWSRKTNQLQLSDAVLGVSAVPEMLESRSWAGT